MLKPEKVKRIILIGLKKIEDKLIKKLHYEGIIDIDYVDENIETGKPEKTLDEVSASLNKIRGIMKVLNIEKIEPIEQENWREVIKKLEEKGLDVKIKELLSEKQRLENELEDLKEKYQVIVNFAKEQINLEELKSKSINIIAGKISSDKKLETKGEIYYLNEGKERYFLIATKDDEKSSIEAQGAETFDYIGNSIEQEKEMADKIKEIEKRIKEINKELNKIKEQEKEFLQKAEATLNIIAERAIVASKFGKIGNIFVIEGWIKEKDIEKLEEIIEEEFKGLIYFETRDDPRAPTVLNNPKGINNFEFIVEFFSLPKNYEIDPTLLLFFTFPIVYGMMVGDVIYSLFSFIIATFLTKKFKKGDMFRLGRIWQISSIYGMIFGVIFDEWMGFAHHHLLEIISEFVHGVPTGPFYHGISRTHDVQTLLLLSVGVGYLYIILGFFLGVINEWKHSKKHAIGKLGWIVMLIAPLTLIFSQQITIATAIIGFLMMFYGEGIAGVFEIGTVIGNILSFARIAAVGIAGVILAEIINEVFEIKPGLSILYILPLLIILHFMNTGLAMFESTIQGGRLNLVEMYSKFFKGGGKPFKPFYIFKK